MNCNIVLAILMAALISCKKTNTDTNAPTPATTNSGQVTTIPDPTTTISPTITTTGLVLYLPFSGNANDASGNGNHGVVVGPTLATDHLGRANQAYAFARSGKQYIRVPNNAGLNITGSALTFSAWIYPNWAEQLNTNMQIVSKAQDISSAGRKFGVGTDSPTLTNVELRTSTGTFDYYWNCTACTLQQNVWQFITVVYDGAAVKWYKNGTLVYQLTKTGSIVSTTSDLTIGSFTDRSQSFFNGSLDEIRLYNRVLTSTEIAALYQL